MIHSNPETPEGLKNSACAPGGGDSLNVRIVHGQNSFKLIRDKLLQPGVVFASNLEEGLINVWHIPAQLLAYTAAR
jgi:hypothetical protein